MKKKIIVIDDEKQERVLKEALKDYKELKRFGLSKGQNQKNEQKIDDIYTAEKLEKQLDKQ